MALRAIVPAGPGGQDHDQTYSSLSSCLDRLPAQEVGERLDMTPNAVFIVKSRILKRIRELMPDMEKIW